MKARRKRSDPQATRYRVAVTALAKAEKRHAAAEKAIAELRRKVRGYERRLAPERLHEIEGGTRTAKAIAQARADEWKAAERTLRAAARMIGEEPPLFVTLKSSKERKYGLAVRMPEGQALIWDNRRGYLTGRWDDRRSPAKLSKPTHDPIEFLQAAE